MRSDKALGKEYLFWNLSGSSTSRRLNYRDAGGGGGGGGVFSRKKDPKLIAENLLKSGLCAMDAQAESNVFNIQSNSQWNDVVKYELSTFFMYPKCPEGSFAPLLELLCASWDICILL
ncbi:hypothetical protein ACJX0J_038798, partial [Zea mays]